MNAAVATYAGVDHDKVVVFPAIHPAIHPAIRLDVLLVISGILLRASFIGVNAAPITPAIVLQVVNFVAGVIRQRALRILLRLGVKRF